MNKPWIKTYGETVPHEIDADAYRSVVALFEKAVAGYGDLPAFECFGKTMTYREIDAAATAVAAWLQTRLGVRRGDRIALMCPNVFAFPIAPCSASSAPARRR